MFLMTLNVDIIGVIYNLLKTFLNCIMSKILTPLHEPCAYGKMYIVGESYKLEWNLYIDSIPINAKQNSNNYTLKQIKII